MKSVENEQILSGMAKYFVYGACLGDTS